MPRLKNDSNATSTATVGFEQKLWAAADALRNNMDAAEYKHVVLGRPGEKSAAILIHDLGQLPRWNSNSPNDDVIASSNDLSTKRWTRWGRRCG